MRGRHRTSDLGSSRAVQRLGLVRDRLPEERRRFRGVVRGLLFVFRRRKQRESSERDERVQRNEGHQERRQAQVRYLAQETEKGLAAAPSLSISLRYWTARRPPFAALSRHLVDAMRHSTN